MMKKCRLCENEKLSEYYKLDKGGLLYSCNRCGLKQLLVSPVDQLDGVAAKESISQDANRDTSPEDMKINESMGFTGPPLTSAHIHREDSIRVNKTIKKLVDESFSSFNGLKFIDIGSGYGQHSFSLKEEFPELDVHLLEISEERMRSGIESFKPDLSEFTFHHSLLDDDFANDHFEKFDISFSFHVLEHVYDMKGFIKNMFSITRKGGSMILEVPNEDDDLSLLSDNYRKIIHFPAHVSCFTKDTLSALVEESGIGDRVEAIFVPIQRYGFFNYIDWIRHNEKDKVLSDDYISRENPTWIEKRWVHAKKDNFTTDSIAMILRKF
jgi:2-polyprenyl-3-methyl-5-hydroxy-6-metoxy-1,4-benzoquinol methylase